MNMNDDRTSVEKYDVWVNAVVRCHENGWKCIGGWIFESPSGTRHDLSASDLDMLDYIEEKGISQV